MSADAVYGSLIGVGATVVVGVILYWLTGRQLRKEAQGLRRLSEVIARGLEEAGFLKLSRDAKGNIAGLHLTKVIDEKIGLSGQVAAEKKPVQELEEND